MKLTLRTRPSVKRVSETSAARSEVTTPSTPGGRPASSSAWATASAVSGVDSAGLITIEHPAARAGAILRASMAAGKFHGVMAAVTPMGWRITRTRWSGRWAGTIIPSMRSASPANHSKKLAEYSISPVASANGLPCSVVRVWPISAARSRSSAAVRSSKRARSRATVVRQPGRAAWAASMTAVTSAAPASATHAIASPVAGLVTG